MAASEFRLSLGRAIQSLSSQQRQLLHGMYVEGLTLRELGGPMRTDPSTTFYRLKRIYAILREKIEADLRARLHLAANEVDSFVQSMLSGLELRITGLLGATVE
jgi:DNA-directed RNA polymerase specialized sigma24 family protein